MLQKQALDLPFSKGLDQKKDPWRLPFGNFFALVNSVFTKEGRLTKRNGFGNLPALPNASTTVLTTFQNNLTAIGDELEVYSEGTQQWIANGTVPILGLSTLPLVRNSLNQTQGDAATAPNGVVCTAYVQSTGSSTQAYYSLLDSITGQVLVQPTAILGTMVKVFLVGNTFIITSVYDNAGTYSLQYLIISTATLQVVIAQTMLGTTTSVPIFYDGISSQGQLYLAYAFNTTVVVANINANFVVTTKVISSGSLTVTVITVAADASTGYIWVNYWDSGSDTQYVVVLTPFLSTLIAQTSTATSVTNVGNMASAVQNDICSLFVEITGPPSHIENYTITLTPPSTITTTTVAGTNGVGLASKAFIYNGNVYYLAAFSTTYQPSYFLINGSTSVASAPVVVGKLAYSNGGGYLTQGLPNVTQISDTEFSVAYLYKDLIAAVNTATPPPAGQTAGVYSQTGLNLATWTFSATPITAEIGGVLNLTGGILWNYDGETAVENNFNVWPEPITAVWSATGGNIVAQPDGITNTDAYYIQVTYEWTDNVGRAHRSAPSIPVAVTTTGSGTTGSITVTIPSLTLTYKTNVKLCVYRWSVAQEVYYQTTSITTPLINNPADTTQTFVDTHNDATILGNAILYTTGGVLEDIGPPAFDSIALFDTRLWGIDSEDKNLLWFSKPVIEDTPVEMTDLQTFYVAPTTGAQGSTGNLTCLFPMDDKLILFKKDAIYYVNGSGPDITGTNSQYPPSAIFITSTVGTANQQSIVLTPMGLMFQSDKGIWLLGRGLDLQYIGAPVEDYALSSTVNSALCIPGTNQVRLSTSAGIILVYDYYYGQWNTFKGVGNISSTLWNSLHTCVTSTGLVLQETPGIYQDGTSPVLMSFTTNWVNLMQLQAYQRAYFFYLLGEFITPHKLQVQVAYDFNPNPTQTTTINPTPVNYNGAFGLGTFTNPNEVTPFGQGLQFGGSAQTENWRVFLEKQRCQSFQLTVSEVYDSSQNTPPGQGLTLSGVSMVVGLKRAFRPIPSAKSVG